MTYVKWPLVVGLAACAPALAASSAERGWTASIALGNAAFDAGKTETVGPERVLVTEVEDGVSFALGLGYTLNSVVSFDWSLGGGSGGHTARLFGTDLGPPGDPDAEISVDESDPVLFFDVSALFHLAPGRVRPYVSVGAGFFRFPDEAAFAYSYGAGVDFRVGDRIVLRLDARQRRGTLDGEIVEVVDILPDGTWVGVAYPLEDEIRLTSITAGAVFEFGAPRGRRKPSRFRPRTAPPR